MSPAITSTSKDDSLPAQLDEDAAVGITSGEVAEPLSPDASSAAGAAARADEPTAGSAPVAADEPTAGSAPTTAAASTTEPAALQPAAGGAEEAEATAVPKAPGRLRRAGSWIRRHLVAVVAGLVVLALVAGLVLSLLALRHDRALDSARASALTAGQDSAVALSSYDYRTLDKDFAAVTDRSTPDFRKNFTQTSDSLKKVLTQYNATAKSTVVAAGVTSASQKHAVVLVFINQTATNTNQKAGPTTDQSRVQVTLSRPGNRWLIEGVKLL